MIYRRRLGITILALASVLILGVVVSGSGPPDQEEFRAALERRHGAPSPSFDWALYYTYRDLEFEKLSIAGWHVYAVPGEDASASIGKRIDYVRFDVPLGGTKHGVVLRQSVRLVAEPKSLLARARAFFPCETLGDLGILDLGSLGSR